VENGGRKNELVVRIPEFKYLGSHHIYSKY
jgi:hypothetical protein